jgi:hypothetical protein
MQRIETRRNEAGKTGLMEKAMRELEAASQAKAQSAAAKAEVPCSCPGCFPYQF